MGKGLYWSEQQQEEEEEGWALGRAVTFSLTPFKSLIMFMLTVTGTSAGAAVLPGSWHASPQGSSVGTGSNMSRQGTALGRGIASSLGEATSHPSSRSAVGEGLAGAMVAAAVSGAGGGDGAAAGAGGVCGGVGSATGMAGSCFSAADSARSTEEDSFNTGSGFGFSSCFGAMATGPGALAVRWVLSAGP